MKLVFGIPKHLYILTQKSDPKPWVKDRKLSEKTNGRDTFVATISHRGEKHPHLWNQTSTKKN